MYIINYYYWKVLIKSQTSVISLRAVSQPNENSVPGTLLLIVDGIITIGMQNSGKFLRFLTNWTPAWYAWNNQNESTDHHLSFKPDPHGDSKTWELLLWKLLSWEYYHVNRAIVTRRNLDV